MKVLYLNAYFFPEDLASSYLGHNVREALTVANNDVVLFAPTPSRGVTREIRHEYCSSRKNEEWYSGRMIIRRFGLYKEGRNPFFRAIRYFLVSVKLFNRAVLFNVARSCDVMMIPSTPPIMGITASLVKKMTKKPFIYVLQDIFPDSLVGTGLTHQGSLLWKIGRKIERITYKNADHIIVISQDFKRNLLGKGVPEEKISVIYNWVDEGVITPVEDSDNELFEEFMINHDIFRVVYAGNLGNAQNIDLILNAARRLVNNRQIEFIIFGKGGLENEIRKIIAKENLDNLKFLPLQPYDRVSKVYGLGNLCIVACKPGLGGAAMPSKTWNIMSSGRAVLANFDDGELRTILEDSGCGVFTKSGDLDTFVETIEYLSQHPDICVEMGKKGRQFILDNLTRSVGTNKYLQTIQSVVHSYET